MHGVAPGAVLAVRVQNDFFEQRGPGQTVEKSMPLHDSLSDTKLGLSIIGWGVCPTCGASLQLSVRDDLQALHLRCSKSSLHLSVHRNPSFPQQWWRSYVAEGWL